MRGEWETVTIGDVCDFYRGLTYQKSDEVELSSNVVLRANNIALSEGVLNFDELKYIRDDIVIPENKKIQKDTLLVCTASGSKKHLGKVAYVDVDYDYGFGGFMGLLKPKKNVYPKFLYWVTASKNYSDFIMGLADGANINNLKFSQLSQFSFPLPPISEQKRIVAILDEAFARIDQATANTEKNLASARELFESSLNTIFTKKGERWVNKRLCEICDKITDGTHQTPKYFDSGFIFLSSKNVKNGVLDWDDIKYIDEEQHVKMQKRLAPRMNDILLRKNGAGYGKAALVDKDIIFDVYVSLAVLRPLEFILPKYLLHFINSPIVMGQFNDRIKGAGVPNLHLEEIREVVVSFPETLEAQRKIVKQLDCLLDETSQLSRLYETKQDRLEELKRSLLQKAFSGELTAGMHKLAEAAE